MMMMRLSNNKQQFRVEVHPELLSVSVTYIIIIKGMVMVTTMLTLYIATVIV